MVFAPLRCLLTAKQTCFVAGLAIAIIVFVTSSTRSVPMANTDAGQPPSSEELSEPLPLVALGAAGAVESETCVPICDRSPCAEPEVKRHGTSFCSYGRRQSQFLTNYTGADSVVEVFRIKAQNSCAVSQNKFKDLGDFLDSYTKGDIPVESAFNLVKSGLNPSGVDLGDFPHILAHEFHTKALGMTNQQRQDLHVLILGSGGGVMTTAMRDFLPTAVVDTVDIDDAMVHAAKEWFCAPRGSRYRYHVQDAYDFVSKASTESYDFLYVDIAADASEGIDVDVPAQFLTLDFLSRVGRVLKPGGLGAMNFVGSRESASSLQRLADFRKILQGLFEVRERPKPKSDTSTMVLFLFQKR